MLTDNKYPLLSKKLHARHPMSKFRAARAVNLSSIARAFRYVGFWPRYESQRLWRTA
jgi:hypothetical protein